MQREDRAPYFGLILICLQEELLSDKDSHLVTKLRKYLLSNNTVSHLAGCSSHSDSKSVLV